LTREPWKFISFKR